ETGSERHLHRGIHDRSPEDRGRQARHQRLCAAEMRRAALLIAVLLSAPAFAETPADFPAAISVTGEAQISVAPDLATIDAGVATEAKTAREASDANNAAMGKVLAAVKGANIDAKDIQTSQLSLQQQYAPNRPSGPPQIVGYRASNRVTVKIHDVTKVG